MSIKLISYRIQIIGRILKYFILQIFRLPITICPFLGSTTRDKDGFRVYRIPGLHKDEVVEKAKRYVRPIMVRS